MSEHKTGSLWHTRKAYFFILPSLFLFFFFFLYPLVYTVYISTTNANFFNIMKEPTFIGLENYRALILGGGLFYPLVRTVLFMLTSIPLKVLAGLLLAFLFNSSLLKAKRILYLLILLPWAAPWFFLVLIWRGMLNQDFGAINQILSFFSLPHVNWLNDTLNAFLAYNIVEVYMAYPFMMSVIFGAMQSVPSDLYESASMDGASSMSKFRYVTLPLIKKSLFWATIMTSIASYLIFGVPFLLNRGGPARLNEFLLVYGYKEAFDLGLYGYAAAFMVLVFILLIILVIPLLKLTKIMEE